MSHYNQQQTQRQQYQPPSSRIAGQLHQPLSSTANQRPIQQPPQQQQRKSAEAHITCNKCQQPILDGRNVLTPCYHVFCYVCAQTISTTCPACNVNVDPKEILCIGTTETDVQEHCRRLCVFSPNQLMEMLTFALKWWGYQQRFLLKLQQHTLTQDFSHKDQQFQQQLNELQQSNTDLVSQNQKLINSNSTLKQYIQQLESQVQSTGGALPPHQQHPYQQQQQPPPPQQQSIQNSKYQYQPPQMQHNQNQQQQHQQYSNTRTPAYAQTPGYPNNRGLITPFVPRTNFQTNQQTPGPPNQTPGLLLTKQQVPHSKHTTYPNGGAMTPVTPTQDINPATILGKRY